MSAPVVTRFAPSPTGYLHIGGARTALFNWLYAKHTGGKMLLRIEDTDRERSTEAATAAILDGLNWLGLTWDGEPVSQFERAARHREVAEELVRLGKAYHCYASQEELAECGRRRAPKGARRDTTMAAGAIGLRLKRLTRPARRAHQGATGGRDARPRSRSGRCPLSQQGSGRFHHSAIGRGSTYMHAVVVDDHDMGVTHIIRGDDHLTNAARQTIIYDAMGWDVPVMAHIPLIHGADGAKLSKRHGALGVEAYRAMGYLPEALRNYLARLGWSHGDDEFMTTADMVSWFEIEDVNKGAARFDFAKLEALNGLHMRRMDDEALASALLDTLPYFEDGRDVAIQYDEQARDRLVAAMPGLKERAKTLVELADSAAYLTASRPLDMEEKAFLLIQGDGREALAGAHSALSAVDPWTSSTTEAAIRQFAETSGRKLGQVAQPLRAALTGRTTSPGVFDVLAVLGREESLGRIADRLA